jgi:lipoate---protein ligase
MSPPSVLPGPWRYLEQSRPEVVEDLAIDEALLEQAEASGEAPVLRVWEARALAVVLGASGRLREEVHVEACRADGVPIARRSSGGGTVVVGPGALNVAVVLAQDAAPGLGAVDQAQGFVLERIGRAIRDLGPPVEVLGSGDLTIGRRKFAGSAQRWMCRPFLLSAPILSLFPLEQISRYTPPPRRQPSYREGRSHAEFLVNLGLPRDALLAAVRAAWLPPDRPPEPASVPEERVRRLVATKFADPAWIERL